jgi:hypothetical protein
VNPDNSEAKILLLHDDELRDVRSLLASLSIAFVERNGDPTDVDKRTAWDLIIASQKRVSCFEDNEQAQKTRRIAVVESDSRTLRSMLKRLGVDYVVARPVHAAALRLLVLHCVYQGPERRRLSRVSVGAKIQQRSGLMKHDAILADISLHGCRLVCDRPVKAGSKMKLFFPPEMGSGRGFVLTARVLRTAPATPPTTGHIVAGAFQNLKPAQGQRLRRVFESYKNGPAKLMGPDADLMGQSQAETETKPSERRAQPRMEYEKHIVTVNEDATRVLLCRDISIGGMRVEPNETLVPGDDMLVAVHIRSRSEPLVVNARVARDDGKEGLVLVFHDLSKDSEEYLEKMVNLLPMLGVKDASDDENGPGLIISEIVERRAS